MADSDDFERDESSPEEETPPTPKNNLLTIVLLLANVVAALGFVFLLVMDYQKRQEWAYAVFRHALALQGSPQVKDEGGVTADLETLPRQRLSGKDLEAVFSGRGGRGGNFASVDEVLRSPIKPSQLDVDTQRAHFGDLPPVKTMEDEIVRLQKKLPDEIEAAAKETAAKEATTKEKRERLKSILLSLAYDVYQVKRLDDKVAKADALELDKLLIDAAQRRMYVDLLAPLELFRTGDERTFARQRAANRDSFKVADGQGNATEHKAYDLEELKKLLDRHLTGLSGKLDPGIQPGKDDWDSMEKRRAIAFFLADVAFLQKPDGTLLDPQALTCAQLVAGLYAFPSAVQSLVQAWNKLEKETLYAIKVDREGMEVKSKEDASKFLSIPGFVDQHQNEIARLLELKLAIERTEDRLTRLKAQNKAAEELYTDRQAHMVDVSKRIVAARKKTAEKVAELRAFQKELFDAQQELSEAAERVERLEMQQEKLSSKGAKAP